MRSRWQFASAIACGVALVLLVWSTGASAQRVKVGSRAPEVDLSTLAGGKVKLSELRGHPVVLSYWATWCPSCRSELSELTRAHATHSAAGLRVLSVNGLDQEQQGDLKKAQDKVRRYVEPLALPFDVALDKRGAVLRAYGILALPSTVFIDSGGAVRHVHRGTINREEMDRGIATILVLPKPQPL